MRSHGTIVKWNRERGFGFVALPQTKEEIFVHISAFPRDGVQPSVGETISFEIGSGPDGRKRATQVWRPGARVSSARRPSIKGEERRSNWFGVATSAVAVLVLGAIGYSSFNDGKPVPEPEPEPVLYEPAYVAEPEPAAREEPVISMPHPAPVKQQSRCDGRTHCSQMTSCAEATYFLRNCPNTKMDGDRDGSPCETQWCN